MYFNIFPILYMCCRNASVFTEKNLRLGLEILEYVEASVSSK